jgi:N-acetylglutamate synthase-like GNAT family acetyltransferase
MESVGKKLYTLKVCENGDLKNGEKIALLGLACKHDFHPFSVAASLGVSQLREDHYTSMVRQIRATKTSDSERIGLLSDSQIKDMVQTNITDYFEKSLTHTIYYVDGYKIIAFLMMRTNDEDQYHEIDYLLVHKDYRNDGIGKHLMKAGLTLRDALNEKLRLSGRCPFKTVLQSDIPEFFMNFGFKPCISNMQQLPEHVWMAQY